jgi:hypothetical protein
MNTNPHKNETEPAINRRAVFGVGPMKTHPLLLTTLAGFLSLGASAQTLSNYQWTVMSQSPMSYFTFDTGLYNQYTITNAVATNTAFLTVSGQGGLPSGWEGGFAPDVYRNQNKSILFSGTRDAVDVYPNTSAGIINGGGARTTTSTNEGSISCLFRTLDSTNNSGRRHVFMAGGDPGTNSVNALALFFEGPSITNPDPLSLRVRLGNKTETILQPTDILPASWYYFALAYTEATNTLDATGTNAIKGTWYLGRAGGTLATGRLATALDAVAGDANHLVIGNWTNYSQPFRSPGNGRVDEFATWDRQLSFTEISNQFTTLPQLPPPGGTYQQVVTSQMPKYYFKLDSSLIESVGGVLQLSTNGTDGAFTSDVLENIERAYFFAATNDALYITNDLIAGGGPGTNDAASGVGTISFQFRMLSDTNYGGQRFIFSAPGEEDYGTNDNMLALYLENNGVTTNTYPGSLKLRVGNLTKGSTGSSDPLNNIPVEYATNLVPNAWYYFAMTYDEKRNTPEVYLYFGQAGGTLTTNLANPANASVVGNNGWLCLGNKMESFAIGSNAFRNPGEGAIDEFAIWHDELSPAEIRAQFAAMAPAVAPNLTIVQTGSDVIVSWPTGTPSTFVLESTNVLDATTIGAPSWPSAGSPSVAGTSYVVTNTVSSDNRFYRLHKP